MSNIITYDPFAEFRALQKQLFNDTFFDSNRALKAPTTDIWTEGDSKLIVEAHLPHFEQKDIDVQVEDGALVIRAEKHEQEKDKNRQYIVRESSSSFYRRIRLPQIANKDAIKAQMEDGVLTVNVPFKELPQPKKISIENKNK